MNTNSRRDDRKAFARLATKRTNNAIRYIRLLGNLSNRSNYSYTEQDVKKIFGALKSAIGDSEELFFKPKKTNFVLE